MYTCILLYCKCYTVSYTIAYMVLHVMYAAACTALHSVPRSILYSMSYMVRHLAFAPPDRPRPSMRAGILRKPYASHIVGHAPVFVNFNPYFKPCTQP